MQTPEAFLSENGFVTAAEINRVALIGAFISEMEKGLAGEPSSLAMIPTYVGVNGKVPAGAKAAVLDAGGTNFRSAVVSIPPKIENKLNQPMPGTKGAVDADTFYAAFAKEIGRVSAYATVQKIGFCFSYPADATPDLDAKLNCWTKGIQAPEIVGQYVGSELMKRVGGGKIAIVNDTVATLLAAKATEGDKTYSSYIGFILGTGTNAAYVEKNVNIRKLQNLPEDGMMIINAESGNFNKMKRSRFDEALAAKLVDGGHNPFEKMISGGYLGPLGLEVFKAAAKAGFFSEAAARKVTSLAQLETMDFDNFLAAFSKD